MRPTTRIYVGGALGYLAIVVSVLAFFAGGCATVKTDAKAIAEVCRPELLPDVVQAAPAVGAYVACEMSGGDCSEQLSVLSGYGKADLLQCAAAEAHQATVKLATTAATP